MNFDVYILHIDDEKSLHYAEDCRQSCLEYNIEPIMFKGYKGLSLQQVDEILGVQHDPTIKLEEWAPEYNCDLGHISIWKKIVEANRPGIIFEHDVIVKQNFDNLKVEDEEIIFLGPRVNNRDDYNYPNDYQVSYNRVRKFEGAHAYAITPNTARYLLQRVVETNKTLFRSIDGHLGIRNTFNLKLKAIDPALVVCEVGNRFSYIGKDSNTPKYNRQYFPGFLSGVDDHKKLLDINDYVFSEDWFSPNIPIWIENFNKLNYDFQQRPFNILEIGSFEGRSSCWISDNLLEHPESRMCCVDTFQGSPEHSDKQKSDLKDKFMKNIMNSKYPEKISTYVSDSKTLLSMLILNKASFDIIYVDGSHESFDVLVDGLLSSILLKKGGLLIFDDYRWTYENKLPVRAGVNRLEEIVVLKNVYTGWQKMFTKE